MLTLPIKKKWFDLIKNGIKKEEYREIKPYYDKRFRTIPCGYIAFRNGYSKTSPTIVCLCKLRIGIGKEEWGAEPNKMYYVLKILSVEVIL